jgi:NAD(P)-dependent dehydrogenase (short-subunit alcohol dehydrogenase family)
VGGAVVTGAAKGMGLEIARLLAARGYAVTLADIDAAGASDAAEGIGGSAKATALDVADEEAVRALAHEVAEREGALDVWVNNAGILRTAPSWTHSPEERRAMFDVNTFGLMNGTLAALEHMRGSGRGHVINIISLAGLASPPGEVVYAASKHAAMAFSIGTLYDLREAGLDDVHISCVCPDGVWTPMLFDKVDDPHAAPSWSGVMLQPAQVAEVAVGLIDKPRPVITIPRWRGAFVRAFDAFPGVGERLAPRLMEQARRRQAAFRQKRAR